MSQKIYKIYTRFFKFIGSDLFCYLIIGVYILEGIWVACSAFFPMPFDEFYHTGVIKVYATQWTPFFSHQPQSANFYGDITRMSSYLFHYLMSFPYRILGIFIATTGTKIIILRLINVAMVALGLLVFKKLFIEAKISAVSSNLTLLAVSLIPILALLGPTVNYDNMLFLFMPISLLYAYKIYQARSPNAQDILIFLSISMLASLVKFSYLPIMAALSVYLFVAVYRRHGKRALPKGWQSYKTLNNASKILVTLFLVLSLGLFLERYGLNLVRYRSVNPSCSRIQPASICNNSLNGLNAKLRKNSILSPAVNGIVYTLNFWLPNMSSGAVSTGANTSDGKLVGGGGPVILYLTMWAFGLISVLVIAYYWRELWSKSYVRLFSVAFVSYLLVLWLDLYGSYHSTREPLAIQSRYLLIVIPLFLVVAAEAWRQLFSHRVHQAALVVIVLLLISTQGGGFITYVYRSQPNWYIQRYKIIKLNSTLKSVITPFIVK